MTQPSPSPRVPAPPSIRRELLAILVLYAAIAVLPILLGLATG